MSTKFVEIPSDFIAKIVFLFYALFDPFIIISLLLTLLGGFSWMITMAKFELNYAYPFIGLTFLIILIAGNIFFNEPFNIYRVLGTLFIVIGVILSSKYG
jgi:drug/metabolite transporter (DMT)-like permease